MKPTLYGEQFVLFRDRARQQRNISFPESPFHETVPCVLVVGTCVYSKSSPVAID